jgi:hypothetical protein
MTPYENFLYLLAEIERALDSGTIEWPPGAASQAWRRAVQVLAALAAIASEESGD